MAGQSSDRLCGAFFRLSGGCRLMGESHESPWQCESAKDYCRIKYLTIQQSQQEAAENLTQIEAIKTPAPVGAGEVSAVGYIFKQELRFCQCGNQIPLCLPVTIKRRKQK